MTRISVYDNSPLPIPNLSLWIICV